MPDWFKRRTPHGAPPVQAQTAREAQASHDAATETVAQATAAIPEGAFTKCAKCGHILYAKDFERDLKVCSKCGHHHRLTADERIAFTVDEGSWVEWDREVASVDPLGFPEYAAKAEKGRKTTGRNDVLVSGTASIGGQACALLVADFAFMGGSMGSAFGEKFARGADRAIAQKIPLVIFCASGGARMQEGLFGLMQMAKTSALVAQLAEEKIPYVVVLTDPTTGGAFASFASLGDVIYAEPGAYVAFAGTRVAQQAQTQKPPANYQTAEFQHEHGMVDKIVARKELPTTLARTLAFFGAVGADATTTPQSANGADRNGVAPSEAVMAGRNGSAAG